MCSWKNGSGQSRRSNTSTSNSPWLCAVSTTQGTTRSAARVGRVLPTITCSFGIGGSLGWLSGQAYRPTECPKPRADQSEVGTFFAPTSTSPRNAFGHEPAPRRCSDPSSTKRGPDRAVPTRVATLIECGLLTCPLLPSASVLTTTGPEVAPSGTRATTKSSELINTEPSLSPKRTLGRRNSGGRRLFPMIRTSPPGNAKLGATASMCGLPLTFFFPSRRSEMLMSFVPAGTVQLQLGATSLEVQSATEDASQRARKVPLPSRPPQCRCLREAAPVAESETASKYRTHERV